MPIEWIWGLIGGLIIGAAGAVFLLGNGRIMGASGLIGGLVDRTGWGNGLERLVFILGLFAVPMIFTRLGDTAPQTNATSNIAVLIGAGLLVGIGTRIANGCTSGHGVCGISRLSLRGMGATVAYIVAGGLSVVLFRHILGII